MRKLVLLSFPVLITLFLAEVGLRLSPYRALLLRPIVKLDNKAENQFYIPDDILGFAIRPNSIGPIRSFPHDGWSYIPKSNEIGCYDHSINEIRIKDAGLAIGDSFTFSTHELGHGWPSLLENISQEPLIKCGVDSYGTKQELEWTKRILNNLHEKPKYLLLQYYTGNDMFDDYLNPAVIAFRGQKISRLDLAKTNFTTGEVFPRSISEISTHLDLEIADQPSILAQNSILIALFEGAISKKGISSLQIPNQTSPSHSPSFLNYDEVNRAWLKNAWTTHLETILNFKTLAESYQIPLHVLIIPTNDQVYPFLLSAEEQSITDLLQPNRIVTNFLADNKIPYLDILDPLRKWANQDVRRMLNPKTDFYNKVDGHFSILGEEYTAILVARYLAELGVFTDSKEILKKANNQLEAIELKFSKNSPKLISDEAPQILSYGPNVLSLNSIKSSTISFWIQLTEVRDSYIIESSIGSLKSVKDHKQSVITFEASLDTISKYKNIDFKIYDRAKGLYSNQISISILN